MERPSTSLLVEHSLSDSVESSSLQPTPLAAFDYSGSTQNKPANSIRSVPLSQRTSISGFRSRPDRYPFHSVGCPCDTRRTEVSGNPEANGSNNGQHQMNLPLVGRLIQLRWVSSGTPSSMATTMWMAKFSVTWSTPKSVIPFWCIQVKKYLNTRSPKSMSCAKRTLLWQPARIMHNGYRPHQMSGSLWSPAGRSEPIPTA